MQRRGRRRTRVGEKKEWKNAVVMPAFLGGYASSDTEGGDSAFGRPFRGGRRPNKHTTNTNTTNNVVSRTPSPTPKPSRLQQQMHRQQKQHSRGGTMSDNEAGRRKQSQGGSKTRRNKNPGKKNRNTSTDDHSIKSYHYGQSFDQNTDSHFVHSSVGVGYDSDTSYQHQQPPPPPQFRDRGGYSADEASSVISGSVSSFGSPSLSGPGTGTKNNKNKTKKKRGLRKIFRGGSNTTGPVDLDDVYDAYQHPDDEVLPIRPAGDFPRNATPPSTTTQSIKYRALSYGDEGSYDEMDYGELGYNTRTARRHRANSEEDQNDSDYDDDFFGANDTVVRTAGRESWRHHDDYAAQHLRHVEMMTQKPGENPSDETFPVRPEYAYPNIAMTRSQLRNEMNAKSSYYHDLRLVSEHKQELGQLHFEILQCFGLPTSSYVTEVSAYGVAVHGHAAFQTDIIPNNANPMWLSKMRRACMFPIKETYSKLYIGIFDLEATIEAPPETIKGHPGHPGWVPPQPSDPNQIGRRISTLGSMVEPEPTLRRRGSGGQGYEAYRRASIGGATRGEERGAVAGEAAAMHGPGATTDDEGDEDNDDEEFGLKPAPYCTKAEDFLGHVVISLARLRPGSTYDVTLPLRRSTHVFTREPQGSVRVRIHLTYNSERAAVMSYLPQKFGGTVMLQKQPNMRYTVNCVDDRSARNVAHAVHGVHMPGKFSLELTKSTIREINWVRIHITRYVRKRELYHLLNWVYPSISGFVFLAWMHGVYHSTVRYVPGHIVIFFLLHLLKNYAYYAMDSPLQNGFIAPTLEELYWALMRGTKKKANKYKHFIEPLTVEKDTSDADQLTTSGILSDISGSLRPDLSNNNNVKPKMDKLYDESGNLVHASRVPLSEISEVMIKSMDVQFYRRGFKVFKNSFPGDAAVDFLIDNGYAYTRPEAVQLGRRLQYEKRLFEHVSGDEHFMFEDSPFMYHFLEFSKYIIKKSHIPRGGRLLELLGFYTRTIPADNDPDLKVKNKSGKKQKSGDSWMSTIINNISGLTSGTVALCGGADILESREHVEFPFATGMDHPRFTIKESLVIRSDEAKEQLRKEELAKAMVEVAEFGIVPTGSAAFGVKRNRYDDHEASEHDTASSRHSQNSVDINEQQNRRPVRRGSILDMVGTAGNFAANVAVTTATTAATAATTVATTMIDVGAGAIGASLRVGNANDALGMKDNSMMEVATNEEMWKKMKEQNNEELNKVMELQRQADEYDPYAYDSDTDVKMIDQKKKSKKYVIVEKHLKKPMSQEIGGTSGDILQVDMSLAKALAKARRQINSTFYHMFDDQVYKVDRNLYPARLDEIAERKLLEERKKKKKKQRGFFNRRISSQETKEEEERYKRLQLTPFERRQDEMDKILLINQYSHSNPWINRIGLILQPLVEMSQTMLFATRALFNVFTWQDPVLCFWLCFLGPILAVILYVFPFRIMFGLVGMYVIGPQNFALRVYRESRPGYVPPDFDTVVKKKRIEKVEDFREMQFFSSEAPGNAQIRFRNIDPTQVKQIVVPSNVLMYNRFYDWPPEPDYARVYAAPPPKNLVTPGVAESQQFGKDTTFVFDAASQNTTDTKKKKKKKKGFRKFTHQIRKGARTSIGFVENAGGTVIQGADNVVYMTTNTTVDAVKGTANVTKNVVVGTGKGTKSAAKGTANFLRLRKKKKKYDEDPDDQYI